MGNSPLQQEDGAMGGSRLTTSCGVCLAHKADPVSLTDFEGVGGGSIKPLPRSQSKARNKEKRGKHRDEEHQPQGRRVKNRGGVPVETVFAGAAFTKRSSSSEREEHQDEEQSERRWKAALRADEDRRRRRGRSPPVLPAAHAADDDEGRKRESPAFPPLPPAKLAFPSTPGVKLRPSLNPGFGFSSQCLPKIVGCSPAEDSEQQGKQQEDAAATDGSTTAGSSDADTDTDMSMNRTSVGLRGAAEKAAALRAAAATARKPEKKKPSQLSLEEPQAFSPSLYELRMGMGKGLSIETEDFTPKSKSRGGRWRSSTTGFREAVAALKEKGRREASSSRQVTDEKPKKKEAATAEKSRRGWLSRALGNPLRA